MGLAENYAEQWARELRQRGVTPNGDCDQQRTGYAAQQYKARIRKKPTTLAQMAKAFDKALAAGWVRYVPVPELDALGHDVRLAARDRLRR